MSTEKNCTSKLLWWLLGIVQVALLAGAGWTIKNRVDIAVLQADQDYFKKDIAEIKADVKTLLVRSTRRNRNGE